MKPLGNESAVDCRRHLPDDMWKQSDDDSQPKHYGPQGYTAAASTGQEDKALQDVKVVATALASPREGDQLTGAEDEVVNVTIDFVELTSQSPKIARTLYRADETAYRAACERTHILRTKRRKRLPRVPMKPDCLAMVQLGKGMKLQRREILDRLRIEEARREYIEWELGVAVEKTESRVRRMEAARIIWSKWCSSKQSKPSPLNAVLDSHSGRRLWREFIQNELAKDNNAPSRHQPSRWTARRGGAKDSDEFSKDHQTQSCNGSFEVSMYSTRSLGEEATTSSSCQSKTGEKPKLSKTRSRNEDLGKQPSEEAGSAFTNALDASLPEVATSGLEMVACNQREWNATGDSPVIVAKLHVALERVSWQEDAKKSGGMGVSEFCREWPRDCILPSFIDRTLLEPAWSAGEQAPHDQGANVDALVPARQEVRREVERLYFAEFLGSSEGQTFVVHAVQDGTLEPTEVQPLVQQMTEGAQFDEDAQGFRRIIAHGDQWMLSRLVHDGVEQRVRVEVVEPLLRTLLAETTRQITEQRGELAAIVQYVYSLAASRLQPFVRGTLARRKLADASWELFHNAFLCAAVEIQRMFRGYTARRRARAALVLLASTRLTRLQARVRGVLLRQRVARKWDILLDRQAVEIQRVFRGHRSRGRVRSALKDRVRAQSAELQGWASLVLQKQARVWLARRAVDLKRVEVGLTSRVSELAERLASSDDSRSVSAVFGQIDKDYRKYEKIIAEMKAREEKMAITFVEKVLESRDADIEGAWARFVGAATEYGKSLKQQSEARRTHPHLVSHDYGIRSTELHDEKLLLLMERYAVPARARTLPSAFLRVALPMHLRLRGGSLRPPAQNGNQRNKRKRICDITPSPTGGQSPAELETGGAFASRVESSISSWRASPSSTESSPLSVPSATVTKSASASASASAPTYRTGVAPAGYPNKSSSNGGRRSKDCESRSEKMQTTTGNDNSFDFGCGVGGGRDDSRGGCNRAVADTSDGGDAWSSVASGSGYPARYFPDSKRVGDGGGPATGWENAWDTERASRGLTGDAGSRFPGSTVRRDLPSGLRESVERLCAAAFLRGHVPRGLMPEGTTPGEAYQRYLELPPSLAKIRHEQLCTEASKPVASALRGRGYITVEQLLPLSKLECLVGQAGAGSGETLAAVSLARELRPKQDASGAGGAGGGSSSSTGGGHGVFSPLPSFSRRGLFAGSRRASSSTEGSGRSGLGGAGFGEGRRKVESRGASRSMINISCGYPGGDRSCVTKKKKKALRISLSGLEFEGDARGAEKRSQWEPSKYTSRPEEWVRPPPSVIKQRWDDSTKSFVPIKNYSFDGLYRRHHPLDLPDGNDEEGGSHHRQMGYDRNPADVDHEGNVRLAEGERHSTVGRRDCSSRVDGTPPASLTRTKILPGPAGGGDLAARRMKNVLREEYGTFFDGMTQSARDLHQHMIKDSTSWGSVDDPIGTLLRRAAFFIVEHPSPATRAELAAARAKDLAAKGFGGKTSLARPSALAGKFKPTGLELELAQAALAGEQVPTGPAAFREFIRQLDATRAGQHPAASSRNTPKATSTGRAFGGPRADPCRTLLERRLEAAATLADPFKLRLEADGISSVKVLARAPVRAWGLPLSLVEEVERMLGLLAAKTCASDHLRAHRGRRKFNDDPADVKQSAASLGRVHHSTDGMPYGGERLRWRNKSSGRARKRQLFEFDPRFQRSPIDPFGRPPRLESIQPCPVPRPDNRVDVSCDRGPEDEADDLPAGVWDLPAASEVAPGSDVTVHQEVESPAEEGTAAQTTSLPSCSMRESMPEGTGRRELAEQELINSPREPVVVNPCRDPSRQAATTTSADRDPPSAHATSPPRHTCRAHPRCKAAFARASTLGTHERSHATAPVYHRLRRTPQLFRDPPQASSEGAGAPAEKFRLRTTLPASVRRELQQLHDENVRRRRQSLLAGPGLSGTVTTWAGVVSPGRAYLRAGS